MSRTQADILERFKEAAEDDMFGFRREVLASAMDAETLRAAMPDVDLPDVGRPTMPPDEVEPEARAYLEFAAGKIVSHRGISASRSVDKLRELAWLLGRDDVIAAMDEADYPMYGAPKVKAFADGMGFEWPDDADLARMAEGLPCADDCQDGCGL